MKASALEYYHARLLYRNSPLKTSRIACEFSDACCTQRPLLCRQCLCLVQHFHDTLASVTQQSLSPLTQEPTGFQFYVQIQLAAIPCMQRSALQSICGPMTQLIPWIMVSHPLH